MIARLAAMDAGIVDHRQLRALGMSDRQIDRRLAKGRLHRLFRGVYAVGHRNVSRRGRLIAALRAAGPDALLCGFSGAAWRGLSVEGSGPVDVCVPPTGRRGRGGLRVHTANLCEAERSRFNGLPVVSLPRILLEVAAKVGERKLDKLMAEAMHAGMSPAALSEQLERSRGARGIRALRVAADGYLIEARTNSPPEASFLLLCGRAGIPPPAVNVPIGDREVDFFWPDLGLIVEIDGFGPHRHRERFEGDRERAVELRLAGYEYLPFTPRQVARRPDWVSRCVIEARRRLAARDR